MTTIAEHLGALPSGKTIAMSSDAVGRFLYREYIGKEAERKRIRKMQERLDLYRDECQAAVRATIEKLFKNARVRDWRLDLVDFALFQNLTRRIVNDTATVYAEPATRRIAGDVAAYREFIRVVTADARMEMLNRYLQLLNDVVLYFHVRADGLPVLRIVTPDKFYAVCHPMDPTWLVAILIEQVPRSVAVRETDPHYLVMTEAETFKLDKLGRAIDATYRLHPFGRIPALLVSREQRDDQLLNPSLGEDLVSGHKAIALLNVLMLKNQKSGTRLAYAQGDTSEMSSDQPMDEEAVIEFPDGVRPGTLDMGADPSTYINTARAVIKQIAANHGISETMFDLSYQATSGFEIKLKRIGLHEIRLRQIKLFRAVEYDLARLESDVLRVSGSPHAFDPAGWGIDFGAVDEPGTASELAAWWDWLEEKGLINRVQMYMTLNPEATEQEALDAIATNRAAAMPAPDATMGDKVESLGQLIRAGYEPTSAAAALNLPAIQHTGLPPVTLSTEGAR